MFGFGWGNFFKKYENDRRNTNYDTIYPSKSQKKIENIQNKIFHPDYYNKVQKQKKYDKEARKKIKKYLDAPKSTQQFGKSLILLDEKGNVIDTVANTLAGAAGYFIKPNDEPPDRDFNDRNDNGFEPFGEKIKPKPKEKKNDKPNDDDNNNTTITKKFGPNDDKKNPTVSLLNMKAISKIAPSKRTLVKGIQKHLLPFSEREWQSELKAYTPIYLSFPSTYLGDFGVLNFIQKGGDYDQRTGTQISMVYLFLQVYYKINGLVNDYELHRFIIVYDMQPNPSSMGLPNTQELLLYPEVMSMTNLTYRDRWLILYDNWYSLSKTSNPNLIVQVNLSLHSLKATFPIGNDDLPSFGRLYCFCISDTTATTDITVSYRVRFYNN